ncbi:acyl-CoA dehydrogenase [Paenibacillus sp. UNC499MF]|uniref:acyl-CoA dehydrogenase n=1 Tax=Paenibacillus sp. UNC499MF TaxID=1502751 RepID=UPI00089FFF52|nr:acyl-CoA dehydrogenase [Paenibacillus sp. UNC499MF]SEG67260.1 Acyl-CoA dehydrogenase [Paenibacillus sp. UNC499MF]
MIVTQADVQRIREQSRHMESEGALTEGLLNLIYQKGWFKLFVPDDLNGRMTPLPDALRIFRECSRADGSFGWLVTIGAGGGFFASLMKPEVGAALFAGEKAVVAGSGAPTGTAKRVEGGYLVSGRWKYCSGAAHATMFTANCAVEEAEGHERGENAEIRSFIFMPDQVRIHPDWNTFGLKATGSHSVSVEDLFVPDKMTFLFTEVRAYEDELIYRYPFVPFAQASFAAVALGIAAHFAEEAHEYIRLKERKPHVLSKLEEQEALLGRTESAFYSAVTRSWEELVRHGRMSESDEKQVSEQCLSTVRSVLTGTFELFSLLGLSAAMEDSQVNRTWRDLQTVCQHSLLLPEE